MVIFCQSNLIYHINIFVNFEENFFSAKIKNLLVTKLKKK